VKLLGGNSVVAEEVSKGNLLAGLTDNDDVDAANNAAGADNTRRVMAILPDQEPVTGDSEAFGTLMIPCTVGLVTGARHDTAGKQLVDYLLSAEVEQKMIAAKFTG
jgi:ABC-type Fe3+ transport system substrate-binding protein